MKRNEGFTLVELLVAMVVGSIVTLAATSVLLLGLRYNATSIAQRQNTTRIIMSLLEGVASEGQIKGVESKLDSWSVVGKDDFSILSYNALTRTIHTGESEQPILEGVHASHVVLEGKILTLYIETEDGTYSSSIYCRMSQIDEAQDDKNTGNDDPLDAEDELLDKAKDKGNFVDILLSQYRLPDGSPNPGVIVLTDEEGKPDKIDGYYAQWYEPNWPAETPWCACFISWALKQAEVPNNTGRENWYADVDYFMADFVKTIDPIGQWTWQEYVNDPDTQIQAGDLVFFDWEGGNDPEHVGVVLLANDQFIYTIEGNSAGLVAMRMYDVEDEAIIGYGRLAGVNDNQSVDLNELKARIANAIEDKRGTSLDPKVELDGEAEKRAKEWKGNPDLDYEWSYQEGDTYWRAAGEFRYNASDADQKIASWMDTSGQVGNLSAWASHYGIGVFEEDGTLYIVVLFSKPDFQTNPG